MESAMIAGRELDALVAEKVMEWIFHPMQLMGMPPTMSKEFWTYRDGESIHHVYDLPPYSTSIAAAWEVLEKLHGQKDYCQDTLLACGVEKTQYGYECLLTGVDGEWHETADTAPLAICLAALKAVEQA